MRLAFHWFYLKSRSLLLVYVGVISDSYIDYFLSRCLSKTTTELATMCKHKPKTQFSGFAGVCGFLRAFFGFLRDVCGVFWSRFFVFLQILCKSALHRKSKRGCGVRPAYPTPMQPQKLLLTCAGDRRKILWNIQNYPISMVFGRFNFWWRSQKN